MSPGHCDRRRSGLEALRDNLKLLLRRPGSAPLSAGDHLDLSATTTLSIDRKSVLWVVVLFRHYPRPPLCGRDGMPQYQSDRVSPPGRLQLSAGYVGSASPLCRPELESDRTGGVEA